MSSKSMFAIGELVLCQYGNAWYEARVLQIRQNENELDKYFVHYVGDDIKYDEWVTEDTLHTLAKDSNDKSDHNGTQLKFKKDDQVFCQYKKLLYSAKILKYRNTDDGKTEYFVHYIGWNKKWDEWVTGERLFQSLYFDEIQELKFSDGERVLCDEDDLLYESIILKACQFRNINNQIQSRYLIHYIGWSHATDEWVTEDRLYKLKDQQF